MYIISKIQNVFKSARNSTSGFVNETVLHYAYYCGLKALCKIASGISSSAVNAFRIL
jgi:hypothetical protein